MVTTTVLKRGREEVIHDQHAYILWPFVLGNGVGVGHTGHMAPMESLILV